MSELTPEKSALRVPADHYCAPASDSPRLFPKWVPLGCGTVSLVIVIVLIIAGAFVNSGGGSRAVDWGIEKIQRDVIDMCTKDVSAKQKTDFAAEVSTMRERMHERGVKPDAVTPLLQAVLDAVSDKNVTPAELDDLTDRLHKINTGQ